MNGYDKNKNKNKNNYAKNRNNKIFGLITYKIAIKTIDMLFKP